MFNVHLRVNDSDTAQPTPVRIRITDSEGRIYPPLGQFEEFASGRGEDVGGHVSVGRKSWHYIDGSCEVPLPGGVPLTIEATKGPEFIPVRQEATLGTGQMSLRLTIQRWTNQNSDGWYSGDSRCHFLPPHSALLEGMAEGLSFVHLLALKTFVPSQNGTLYPATPNLLAFSGKEPALEAPGHVVAVNTLNHHPTLGSLALLHCHRMVFPLDFGPPDATDDWSLADWCDQCHRKKGLVVWAEPFQAESQIAPEALADLIMGRIDAVECTPNGARPRDWYSAWSSGFRFPLIGASAKDSNRTLLGAVRTYARVHASEQPELEDWIDAVRAGRTFVTSGPMLRFTVDEHDPGSVIDHHSPGEKVTIRVRLESQSPIDAPLEILVNGEVLERVRQLPDQSPAVASIERDYVVQRPCWIAARCAGSSQSDSFAHTSPIFVRVAKRLPCDREANQRYSDWLSRTIDWVDQIGQFEMPRRKEQLRALLEQARQLLLVRSSES